MQHTSFSFLVVVCALSVLCCHGFPVFMDNNSTVGQLLKTAEPQAQQQESAGVIKRAADEGGLKRISLKSLIDDLENSLFRSAFSVSGLVYNEGAIVPQIVPSKRSADEQLHTAAAAATSTESTLVDGVKVLLQTTEKVNAENGKPAHIIIDRLTVQQHQGGIPFIPAFQVQRPLKPTAAAAAALKAETTTTSSSTEGETKVTTSNAKAEISSTDSTTTATTGSSLSSTTASSLSSSSSSTTANESTIPSSSAATTTTAATTTISATTSTTSTKAPIVELKEAEEELHDKVAEIEAEPVIFSARI